MKYLVVATIIALVVLLSGLTCPRLRFPSVKTVATLQVNGHSK
jgi:hypothetical protein